MRRKTGACASGAAVSDGPPTPAAPPTESLPRPTPERQRRSGTPRSARPRRAAGGLRWGDGFAGCSPECAATRFAQPSRRPAQPPPKGSGMPVLGLPRNGLAGSGSRSGSANSAAEFVPSAPSGIGSGTASVHFFQSRSRTLHHRHPQRGPGGRHDDDAGTPRRRGRRRRTGLLEPRPAPRPGGVRSLRRTARASGHEHGDHSPHPRRAVHAGHAGGRPGRPHGCCAGNPSAPGTRATHAPAAGIATGRDRPRIIHD